MILTKPTKNPLNRTQPLQLLPKAVSEDLKHPLMRLGDSRLLGIGTNLYSNVITTIYVKAGYRKVFWLDKVEDIYFPNMLLAMTYVPARFNDMLIMKTNMVYCAKEAYTSPKDKIFYQGGMANTADYMACIPNLHMVKTGTKFVNWSEKLKKALEKKDSKAVTRALAHKDFRDVYRQAVIHYFMTGFNTELTPFSWPLGALQDGYNSVEYTLNTLKTMQKYAKMTPKEIQDIPDKIISRQYLNSLTSIINDLYQNNFDDDGDEYEYDEYDEYDY